MIHASTKAEDNNKIFMAKWDIKDGFWRMDCQEGEQWYFAYALPQPPGLPTISSSLKMSWVESLPFFCAATDTSRDIAMQYSDTKVGSFSKHKFEQYLYGNKSFKTFQDDIHGRLFLYLVEVYVDDFMSLIIPATREQMIHVATAVMTGIHNVFLEAINEDNDPIC
jgi:hypothetical protein